MPNIFVIVTVIVHVHCWLVVNVLMGTHTCIVGG